ncbi:cytochrome c biogenesis protein CcdA [Aminobacter niigataensis]|uniref:Cytochrome c biogenesis protein CcdA n=1 Tax=Aminobacter niigataensis TaxID=83265 RepID=A0ABR6L986_9HYPH|nr:cytochrome c biogenesis protein CcdA [Aminobacter niigataensis]MBB4653348.1 cytochrome c biogenesis protein CcdA [Aminobacter niigataensis]
MGFSTIFVALGASATAMSRLLLTNRYEPNIVGGAIIIVFGVSVVVRLPWMDRDVRFHGHIPGGRPLGAYLLGLAFGCGWTHASVPFSVRC